jgi:non-canonical purine NTP pyrophosphatase (RdgB/HAM1 family)
MKITFITGNAGKVKQFNKYLSIQLDHQKLDLDEIQSLDSNEVIQHKVKQAYLKIKKTVLVDDTSVIISVLGKLPGPFVKWFLEGMSPEKLCHLVDQYPDRSATATVSVGLYDGKSLKVFKGSIKGQVANAPKGLGGMGWDNVFIPNGYKKTRAEMDEEEYDQTSPRKKALEKLEKYLKSSNSFQK